MNNVIHGKVERASTSVRYYDDLVNKPKINGIEISGNRKGQDYGLIDEINEITNSDIEAMFNENFRMMKEE